MCVSIVLFCKELISLDPGVVNTSHWTALIFFFAMLVISTILARIWSALEETYTSSTGEGANLRYEKFPSKILNLLIVFVNFVAAVTFFFTFYWF